MHAYYSARAPHMAKSLGVEPTGQLREVVDALVAAGKGRDVLELACGTGYWTRFVAPVSRQTVAVDFSANMLAVARAQVIPRAEFIEDDAYGLSRVGERRFEFAYAMHWVSHVPLARWGEFFTSFHARLQPGATVILADDIRRADDGDPYYSRLADRDSYEVRRLPEGGTYEIVKTYFTTEDLRRRLEPFAEELVIHFERPRWWVQYRRRG